MDAQLRAVQSRGPSFGVRVRSRAHQTPFCARGHQKNIAVSENAPGAHGIVPRHCSTALFHGIVPRHCSTRAAGMNTVSAAKPPQRSPCRGAAPTAQSPPQRERANSAAAALAAKPPPRMVAEVPLPSTSPRSRSSVSRAHQTPFCARGHQKNIAVSENAPGAHGIVPRHCSTRAAGMNTVLPRSPRRSRPRRAAPAGPRLYLDAKSSRARPASSTARSTALSLM